MSGGKPVAIVTGGAGGMGLATAKILGGHHHVVIADVSTSKLDGAAVELSAAGVEVTPVTCDVTDRMSVDRLVRVAQGHGRLLAAVHTAGLSPHMADAETIVRVNALGTVNVTSSLLHAAQGTFRLVNVASMAGHMLPRSIVPERAFRRATAEPEAFITKVMRRINLAPRAHRASIAYPMSKRFVIWYSQQMAAQYGAKNLGIVSVSPGTFDTDMGRLEHDHGGSSMVELTALKRVGAVTEIAELLAFCASSNAGYLTGTDILCDGGVMAGTTWKDLLAVAR